MTLYLAPLAALALALLAVSAAAQDQIPVPRAEIPSLESVAQAAPDAGMMDTAPAANPPASPASDTVTDEFAPLSAEGRSIEDFRWEKRLVIVLADSPDNPAFTDQMQMLAERPDDLTARDAVVIFDTDPEARTDIRQRLRPRGFMLVLMDKDGQIAQRKPFPWTVREITRAIDKMPLRQEELRGRR